MGKKLRENLALLGLLVRPILVAILTSLVWRFLFFPNKWHIFKGDEPVFTDAGIPVIAMFHGFIASVLLGWVLTGFAKAILAKFREDLLSFLESALRYRLPRQVHVLLGSMAIITQTNVLLIHYHRPFSGMFMNAGLAFVLTLYYEVMISLDNPTRRGWYRGLVPLKWLTILQDILDGKTTLAAVRRKLESDPPSAGNLSR